RQLDCDRTTRPSSSHLSPPCGSRRFRASGAPAALLLYDGGVTSYLDEQGPRLRSFEPLRQASRRTTAPATATMAASYPLFSAESGRPARSSACCSESQVRTPNPTGTPVSTATRVRPSVAARQT